MNTQSLAGQWQFRQAGTDEWLPATVPGGVHTDLLTLGCIPDPFVGDNEKQVMWVAETDWEYRRTFIADSAVTGEDRGGLVCDGLDTLADVYLNGKWLGHTENMFRQFSWDVKDLLVEGENEIRIVISEVCSGEPADKCARSTSMNSGRSAGRQVTSSSFMTCEAIPPCSFTPGETSAFL